MPDRIPGGSFNVRLIAGGIGLFALVVTTLLGFIYLAHTRDAAARLDATVGDELDELARIHAAQGADGVIREIERRVDLRTQSLYLFGGPERNVAAGNLEAWPDGSRSKESFEFSIDSGSDTPAARKYRARVRSLPDGNWILVAHDTELHAAELSRIGLAITLAGGAVFVAAVLMGLMVGFALLRGIRDLTATALAILEGDRTRRVPLTGIDREFDALAAAFNRLLDDNDALIAEVRGVTDNIAHDLRTPLSRVRHRLERVIAAPQEAATELPLALEDLDGSLATFESLLMLSRLEKCEARDTFEPLDLSALANDVAELHEPSIEGEGMVMRTAIAPGVVVRGERNLLFQALSNLVDNARKYARDGGEVSIGVRRDADRAVVEVADRGRGIPVGERRSVLRRFARLDAARTAPGAGLGLAFVKAIADLHLAALDLEDNAPGLRVVIRLPIARGDESPAAGRADG